MLHTKSLKDPQRKLVNPPFKSKWLRQRRGTENNFIQRTWVAYGMHGTAIKHRLASSALTLHLGHLLGLGPSGFPMCYDELLAVKIDVLMGHLGNGVAGSEVKKLVSCGWQSLFTTNHHQ